MPAFLRPVPLPLTVPLLVRVQVAPVVLPVMAVVPVTVTPELTTKGLFAALSVTFDPVTGVCAATGTPIVSVATVRSASAEVPPRSRRSMALFLDFLVFDIVPFFPPPPRHHYKWWCLS